MNVLYAYFAYGSNLLPERLLQRCPTAVPYAPDVARLDRYEGYPQIYRRYTVDVILDDGTELPALIYEMTPKSKKIRNGLPYPEEYRKICREGANLHKIKNHFIRKRRRKA